MITYAQARAAIQVTDPDLDLTLPPRVTCMRCGKVFEPTVHVGMRYNPNFGVFFFYCEEHDELHDKAI